MNPRNTIESESPSYLGCGVVLTMDILHDFTSCRNRFAIKSGHLLSPFHGFPMPRRRLASWSESALYFLPYQWAFVCGRIPVLRPAQANLHSHSICCFSANQNDEKRICFIIRNIRSVIAHCGHLHLHLHLHFVMWLLLILLGWVLITGQTDGLHKLEGFEGLRCSSNSLASCR